MLGANGGLKNIPIFTNATSNETGGYHGWFHWALRERVRKANGGSDDSIVMWRSTSGNRHQQLFDAWMDAIAADPSDRPARAKMLAAKPKELVNGCYDKSTPPQFIADALPFTSKPESKCSELYPVCSRAPHRRRPARRRYAQVPAEARGRERLQGDAIGRGPGSSEGTVPGGRLRLVKGRDGADGCCAVGVVRPIAHEHDLRASGD